MQIPILNGIYASESADFRQKYPHNMMPVSMEHGISNGYLRPSDGVNLFPFKGDVINNNFFYRINGEDRAAINWKGVCYRVIGNTLYKVFDDGYLYSIGFLNVQNDEAGLGKCILDYSFEHLAIATGGYLFLYDGLNLDQNIDPDLGAVLDVIYIDGYFMTTDGEFLVVTELGDPFSVNPLKYGSSEVDPDRIVGLIKIHNEVYAMNRYTVEAFYNKGSELFPFARIEGSRMNRGLIGTKAKCELDEQIVFLGSGRNEPPAVWIGLNAQSTKISTREIDKILKNYSEKELAETEFEKRVDEAHKQIWIRLIDQILIYDAALSQAANTPIWYTIDYGPKSLCWCYDRWIVGNDSGQIGYLDDSISTVFGQRREWEFQTKFMYNENKGAIVHELELVSLPGRTNLGIDPTIWTSYTLDGETYSQQWPISAGVQGRRQKRLCWFQQGGFDSYRAQKFRGNSDSHIAFARLDAELEGLLY